MCVFNAALALSRLSISPIVKVCPIRSFSTSNTALFKFSACLYAEPLKKKKKMDPAVIRAREERRKKKIERQIKRLEKNARQLKPIEECEVSLAILDQRSKLERKVIVSEQVLEKRGLLEKAWAQYKRDQHLSDLKMLDRILFSQQKALDELKKESEELYEEAIQFDCNLLPFKSQGPVETPAIDNYEAPDGDYQDVSKKWE